MAADLEGKGMEDGESPKKKKPVLFVILGVAILLLGGGGFFVYSKLLAPKPPAVEDNGGGEPVKEEKKGGKTEKKGEKGEGAGEVFSLEPFVVNLSDPKGKRYLKVKIELELESKEGVAKAEKTVPKLRDMVIMMLTSLTFEEVMTPEGKVRVRDELLERANHIMRPERVKDIYFTEFVVQ